MKNLISFFVLSLLFFSCSSDDDNQQSDISLDYIIGEWQIVNSDGTSGRFLEFNSDMTGSYLVYENKYFSFSDLFTYELSANKIILKYNKNGTKEYNILKIGSDKLKFDQWVFERSKE